MMRFHKTSDESGSTLICALGVIVILAVIGGNVLMNCTTRFNATAKQVKGWKEALYAAEAGGDVAYAECRKQVSDAAHEFGATHGWAAASPAPATWTKSIPAFGDAQSLTSNVTVDQFATIGGNAYYRIRASGTARVFGLRRTGMDDRMSRTTKGDSLLRKIDFNTDHFIAAFGDGDGNFPAGLQPSTPVANPQVTRRIELIVVPVLPFEAAVKAITSFSGPGSAGVVDSFDSHNGAYRFVANNPSDSAYADSRNGNVSVSSPTFNQGNVIYGNVTTNGGNLTHSNSNISGTIDNAVAFTIPDFKQPSPPAGTTYEPGSGSTINPPTVLTGGVRKTEFWYLYSKLDGVTINPVMSGSTPVETVVNIVVTGDVGDVTVNKGATAKIYFTGNFSAKAKNTINNNIDGATGVLMRDPANPASLVASTNVSRASHLQLYGISPAPGVTQTVAVTPPGSLWATFYAPSANFTMNGNPDLYGAVVCRNFYGNGNTTFHYDKALAPLGSPTDYRVASYIEDVR